MILTFYNSLVRPHLEYYVQFWSPYFRKDIKNLERIQHRVTRMIPRLRDKSYEEQRPELNLFPPMKRRLRGNLIAVFKIFKGYTNVNPDAYFTLDQTLTLQETTVRVIRKCFETNEAKYFFVIALSMFWMDNPWTSLTRLTLKLLRILHLSKCVPQCII